MIQHTCEHCKAEFEIPKGYAGIGRFCSLRCFHEWRKTQPNTQIEKQCEYCGTTINAIPSGVDRKRFCSRACKDKWQTVLSGPRSPSWDGGEMVGRICEYCGKSFTAKRALVKRGGARFCGYKCHGEYQHKYCVGVNGRNWQGGLELDPYSNDFDKYRKASVMERDGHECVLCGQTVGRMAVHHIDYNKQRSREANLITLCHPCHMKTNGKTENREYWQTRLSSTMGMMGYL
jgi:hypothetical protein